MSETTSVEKQSQMSLLRPSLYQHGAGDWSDRVGAATITRRAASLTVVSLRVGGRWDLCSADGP